MSRSTFTHLFPVLATLVAAPLAHADLADVPPLVTKPLPSPHDQHARCHPVNDKLAKLMDSDPYCGPIRQSERGDFGTAYKAQPKTDVVDDDGKHYNGARAVYDRTKIAGSTSETTFSSMAWLTRFKPPMVTSIYGFQFQLPNYTSAHQDWESTTNDTIDDCNEYVYKRYYGANRYLDTLGQLTSQRRYDEALIAILDNGIPSVNGTHTLSTLANHYLIDYDGRAIAPFSVNFSNTAYEPMVPKITGGSRNPFYNLPFFLAPQGPADGTQFDTDFRAAYAKSIAEPTVSYSQFGPLGEFSWAAAKRNDPAIKALSAGERDDIARRYSEMRSATRAAAQGFQTCITRQWLSDSAATNTLTGKSLAEVDDFLEANQPGAGYTYPVDQLELQLQVQLLSDSTTSSTTLTNLLAAPINGTDIWSQYARTRMGSMLRLLAGYDKAGLQNAVSTTTYTVKSGAFDTSSACAIGDKFQRVRDLLVAEYKRPNGCLSGTTKCDFSAPVFVDDIAKRVVSTIYDADDAKAQCVKTLGVGFDLKQSPVDPAVRHTLSAFEANFKTKYQTIATLLRNAPRSSSLPHSIGDRRDGGSDFGDGTFAAGYHYSGEWGVNVIDNNQYGACQLGGKVAGSLTAYATAFGYRQELVDAGLTTVTQQPNPKIAGTLLPARFEAHVRLLGYNVFDPFDQQSEKPSFNSHDEGNQEIDIIKTTVFIGPVPVSISVGFEFDYGYNLDIGFTQTSTCSSTSSTAVPALSVKGTLTPHAGVAAVVSAYVDLFIAGAGVKGRLTLVDAKLPFTAEVSTKLNSTGLSLFTDSSVKLILTELSGSLSFIVNVLGITVWEAEFFSWDGISQTINLWDDGASYPIATFNSL